FKLCATMENKEDPGLKPTNITMKRALLILNCILLTIGNCGGPMIMRLYFIHGGNRVWLSSWLETAGWPFIFIPLIITYFHRRTTKGTAATTKLFFMRPFLFAAAAVVGILTGLDDYLYAYGVARLPVSTSALIIATQLAFTAAFAFLLVKQKFTPFSINAVVLLTVGAGILAIDTNSDRPNKESNREYIMGFVMTLAAAALYGFILPLVEFSYKKGKQEISYTVVMEFQLVMCFFATLFCTVGMLINNDFKVDPRLKRALLITNCALLTIGNCGGPLIMRLYFVHGGNCVWLSSWLETGGWPLIFIPLIVSYFQRRSSKPNTKFFFTRPVLFFSAAVVGILTGFDDYLYASGMALLPVSTSALIIASQLAFTAGFAFLLVKQNFTPYSVNAVVLLTLGAGVLAMHGSSDRPNNETSSEYVKGFAMTVAAATLYGFVLPLVEWSYLKSKQEISYIVVMEFQLIMCFFATTVCTVGMVLSNDFKILRGVGIQRNNLAVLLPGGRRSHLLRLLFAIRYYNCCSPSSDRNTGTKGLKESKKKKPADTELQTHAPIGNV
ncbi:hypothetical protein Tsubulata_041823, partial [Turnera subulata]